MDIAGYIASGILENYCLGFTSEEDNREVERLAAAYPAIREEIRVIRASFDSYIGFNEIKPSPRVKQLLMHSIYTQQATIDKRFVPLLNCIHDFEVVHQSVIANGLNEPVMIPDYILTQDLPSTIEVINFAAWVNKGHPEEIHHDMEEYIAIIKGACDMFFGPTKKHFGEGEIIHIPAHVIHKAVITSEYPMFALVQRQLLA